MDSEEAAKFSSIETELSNIKEDIRNLDAKFDQYTHLFQFTPVQKLVYGLVAVILLAVIAAIVGLVIINPGAAPPVLN